MLDHEKGCLCCEEEKNLDDHEKGCLCCEKCYEKYLDDQAEKTKENYIPYVRPYIWRRKRIRISKSKRKRKRNHSYFDKNLNYNSYYFRKHISEKMRKKLNL